KSLLRQIGGELAVANLNRGQADTAHRNAVTHHKLRGETQSRDRDARHGVTTLRRQLFNRSYLPRLLNQSREQSASFLDARIPGVALVRIAQVTFDGEVFAEAMQSDVFDQRGLAQALVAGSRRKRHRAGAGENLGRVIKKNF